MNTHIHIANTVIHPPASSEDLVISVFNGITRVVPNEVEISFNDLLMLCSSPAVRPDKDGRAFCPATFFPEYRNKENAQECSILVYDFDDLSENITGADLLACIKSYRSFCYSTFSHKELGKGNRYRVVVAVDEPIPAAKYESVSTLFAIHFEPLGVEIDSSCTSPAQMMFFPACPVDRRQYFEFYENEGKHLDWMGLLSLDYKVGSASRVAAISEGQDIVLEGARNKTLYKLAVSKRKNGGDYKLILQELQVFNDQHCTPPLGEDEVQSIANSVCKNVEVADKAGADDEKLTQRKMATLIAERYANSLHWVDAWRTWMVFNSQAGLWERQPEFKITGLMMAELKLLRDQEADLIKESGSNRYQKIRQIEAAESNNFLSGAEKLLRAIDGVAIEYSIFDANPLIVGLKGGECIDLVSKNVRKIIPNDYLTKTLAVTYDSTADCGLWKKSILEWCCGDRSQADFLQAWAGYCLSGLTTFQGFLFFFGGGKNGKSVFNQIVTSLTPCVRLYVV